MAALTKPSIFVTKALVDRQQGTFGLGLIQLMLNNLKYSLKMC